MEILSRSSASVSSYFGVNTCLESAHEVAESVAAKAMPLIAVLDWI